MPSFDVAAAVGIAGLLLRKDGKEDESKSRPAVAAAAVTSGRDSDSSSYSDSVGIYESGRCGKANSGEPHFDAPADVDVVPTFEGMALKQNLLRGIFEYGFEKPTAIQQRAIVPMTSGRDVIAQAQSGTGKTAMQSISALQVVNVQSRDVQVLCLNPTRELAVQVRQHPRCYKLHSHLLPQMAKVTSAIGDPMTDPIRILVERDELTLEGIKQVHVYFHPCRPLC